MPVFSCGGDGPSIREVQVEQKSEIFLLRIIELVKISHPDLEKESSYEIIPSLMFEGNYCMPILLINLTSHVSSTTVTKNVRNCIFLGQGLPCPVISTLYGKKCLVADLLEVILIINDTIVVASVVFGDVHNFLV